MAINHFLNGILLFSIIILNVFTPNGDGINDFFYIDSKGFSDLEGDLFNRWKKKYFLSKVLIQVGMVKMQEI